MLDGVIEVVAVLEPRPVVADGLADDGIENDGQQAAGEAVVIQVNALHRGSGVEHHGGVEEPRHDAEGPAEIARDRGQSGSEQEGELHGALVDIEVHKNAADDHAQHDGGDVAGVLTEGGEAHDGENAPRVGPLRSPPVARMKAMPMSPLTPMLMSTGAGPNMRR